MFHKEEDQRGSSWEVAPREIWRNSITGASVRQERKRYLKGEKFRRGTAGIGAAIEGGRQTDTQGGGEEERGRVLSDSEPWSNK